METEIGGLKIVYANMQDLTLKVTTAREETEKELEESKKIYLNLRKRAGLLKKFLGT